jgi:PAS domain S-box-containing protein
MNFLDSPRVATVTAICQRSSPASSCDPQEEPSDENNRSKDSMMDSRSAHSDLHLDLERLALVLAGSQQGFWDWDIRTGEVRRNERWAEILGYTLEEIEPTVRQGEDLVHPDDREAVRRSLQDHLEGRTQAHESEHRMRTKDGNYKWVLDSGRIVERDAQGRPTRMSGTHRDITRRKQAEKSLRASEYQFRRLVGNIPGMVYQAQPDWSAQIISHSVQLCGYSIEEFSSRSVSWRDIVHPDDKARVVEEESTLTDRQDSIVQEYRIIAKDGRTVWVSDHKSSVFTEDGKLERIDGVVFDITERHRMAEALEKQHAFLRTIIDLNPNLIFARDREGRFTLVNQAVADAYGTTVENLKGKSDADFNPNRGEVEAFWRTDLEVMNALRVRFLPEEQITDVTGKRRWLQTVKIPLIGEDGRAEQVLGVAMDITVRKEAEGKLRKFSRAVEQSLTTVMITDADGVIEYVNPTFTRLSGYTAEEVIGKRPSISKSGITNREEYSRLWQTITDGGEWKGEFLNKRKDGQLYWVSSSISPIRDPNGVVVNFLAIQEDVTEHKRMEEALAKQNGKMAKELALAGRVQRSLLPIKLPAIAGWEVAVKFEPAGEASGDFFDVRLLPNGNLCVLVADVIGKGVSAALFMALTWHAIRVYADQFPANPEQALGALNNYVLRNVRTEQYATIFFGILDPASGKLCYCNAGHHPPFIVRRKNRDTGEELKATGIPVGFIENTVWEQATVELDPGDLLAIYTDGVTEALSLQETFFGETRLLSSIQKQFRNSPRDVVGAVFAELQTFIGDGALADDIILLVIKREELEKTHPHPEGNDGGAELVLQ